jgi:hypothetical protein
VVGGGVQRDEPVVILEDVEEAASESLPLSSEEEAEPEADEPRRGMGMLAFEGPVGVGDGGGEVDFKPVVAATVGVCLIIHAPLWARDTRRDEGDMGVRPMGSMEVNLNVCSSWGMV